MINIFNKPKPNILVLIKETDSGIYTYMSRELFRASDSHKRQLKEFIKQIDAQLEVKT